MLAVRASLLTRAIGTLALLLAANGVTQASTNFVESTLWVGGSDVVTHISSAGAIMNTSAVPGFHNGLEVGNIEVQVIPEPGTLLISGLGLASLVLFKKKSP